MSAPGKHSIDPYQRNKSLDYLRGLMATSIMLYHYFYWSGAHLDAGTILGRLSIYGVSIFYVLSGLTLYIVYNRSISTDFRSILAFLVKRIFRIFPLLWLTITGTMIIYKNYPGWKVCFLNYTGLFGFFHLGSYLAAGQWSIGNELVFYLFFPLFLILSKWRPKLFLLLSILSIISGLYFAFHILKDNGDLASQWIAYINPFNQLLFFAGGILIGYTGQWINAEKYKNQVLALLAIGVLSFAFYPVTGDNIHIVTGFNRVFFLCISWMICFCFYHQKRAFPGIADRLLTTLGEASYSIYLLHPLVLSIVTNLNAKYIGLPSRFLTWVSAIVTVLVSYIVYKKLEMPFIRYGKRLVTRFNGDRFQKTDKDKEQMVLVANK